MFEQIRSNQKRSTFVVILMAMLLIGVGMSLGMLLSGRNDPGAMAFGAVIGLVLWLVLWLVAATSGDRIMLSLANAREIQKLDHPRLFNVVEEMTIASGLPKPPRVFVVDDPAPNAFATGRKPERAAVTVTTGLLQMMNRDELQGVVAHEIGHIKNRDIALLTTAGIMVGTIVILADLGQRILWYGGGRRQSRDSGKTDGVRLAITATAILLIVLAPLLAQLLYFSLSRRREYLADASGALFTRYPEGLASALEKIGSSGTRLADRSHVTAPMYIAEPRQAAGRAASGYATHPPLAERVRILRAMGGNAGFKAYEVAARRVSGKSLIGSATLSTSGDVEVRAASPAGDTESEFEQVRAASDAYLAGAGYVRRLCTCGSIIKIPPAMQGRLRECPRCGEPLKSPSAGG